jgi:hypothetical protein
MRFLILATAAGLALAPVLATDASRTPFARRVVDTLYVQQRIDYDELSRRVAARLASSSAPTVIEGDLIVKGRLGVGGAPEQNTSYGITVRGPNDAAIRFISNEALRDPQREGTQHRHVGTVSLGQDGGLRFDQNSTCRGEDECVVDDTRRRRAYSGFDSMGDMSFYVSDVDSATGKETAPRAQSLVFRLLDWDGNIHIHAHRPGQRIFFNSSTAIHAADLQWEVPLK